MPDDRQGSVPYNATPVTDPALKRSSAPVLVDRAPGLALGGDGYFHPLETDGEGALKTANPSGLSAQDEQLQLLRAIAFAMAELTNRSLDDLLQDANDGE